VSLQFRKVNHTTQIYCIVNAASRSVLLYDTRRFFFRDDGCDGKTTLGVTAELHYEHSVDVYVGMPCSVGRNISSNISQRIQYLHDEAY